MNWPLIGYGLAALWLGAWIASGAVCVWAARGRRDGEDNGRPGLRRDGTVNRPGSHGER